MLLDSLVEGRFLSAKNRVRQVRVLTFEDGKHDFVHVPFTCNVT